MAQAPFEVSTPVLGRLCFEHYWRMLHTYICAPVMSL